MASAAKVPIERELTIILTPSLSSVKSQIADYSGLDSRASIGIAFLAPAAPETLSAVP
jgi:hypothetical protein